MALMLRITSWLLPSSLDGLLQDRLVELGFAEQAIKLAFSVSRSKRRFVSGTSLHVRPVAAAGNGKKNPAETGFPIFTCS